MGEKECEEVKANYCTCKRFRCFIHHIVTSEEQDEAVHSALTFKRHSESGLQQETEEL